MSDSCVPLELKKREDNSIEIRWSDGVVRTYTPSKIRDACPCATCREKRKAEETRPKNLLKVLSTAETVPLAIAGMRPVGNYAYNITFSDGHSSGLFTMELLRDIGQAT